MAWSVSILLSILSAAIGFFGYQYGAQYIEERDEMIRQSVRDNEFETIMTNYRYQIDDLRSEQQGLHDRLKRVQAERDSLFAVSQSARALQERDVTIIENNGMTEQLQQQVATFKSLNNQYTKGIAKMSKQMLLEKFGRGPYRVEMQMAFTGKERKLREGPAMGTIVLEMATADEMPHTVYMFLSRVIGGLYNGCSFYYNADHVIVAGAVPNALSPPDVDVRQRFVDAGLDRVHFQEYSESWPHLEWTVGLAGRPGGTEFYINKRDNSADHGPEGKSSYEVGNSDPCFAKVVRGFDIVDRMNSFMDGTNSDRRVAIMSAKVI
jgi:cyclophilin family peptidyl-prolyl cis-trans isomerase